MPIEEIIARTRKSLEITTENLRLIKELCDPIAYNNAWAKVLNNQNFSPENIWSKDELSTLDKKTRKILNERFSDYRQNKKNLKALANDGFVLDLCNIQVINASIDKNIETVGLGVAYHSICTNYYLAHEMVQALIGRQSTEAEILNDKANDLIFKDHNFTEAITLLDQALELSPEFSLAWINKGIALKNLNQIDEAIACYDKVTFEIDQNYKKAWHNKAVACAVKGDISLARVCADTALEIDPDYAIAASFKQTLY
jgi:tetratricopeptide (TPR) repeat protein